MFSISVIFQQSISYENIKDKIGTKKFEFYWGIIDFHFDTELFYIIL